VDFKIPIKFYKDIYTINPNTEDGCSMVVIALGSACASLMACISPETKAVWH